MTKRDERGVPLSKIAAFLNNPAENPDILVFDGCPGAPGLNSFSFRIEALMFLICTGGRFRFSIDLKEYDVSTDTLVILNPNNYVNVWECSEDFTCSMTVCSLNTIETIISKPSDLLPVIVSNARTPVLHLAPPQSRWLRESFSLIKDKIESETSKFRMRTIQGIMQAVLYDIMDIIIARNPSIKDMSSRKEELMVQFIIAVIKDFRRERKVEYYADKLCITSKHLSAVVKELTGVTAGKIIDDYVILEAKILLRKTDLTIQEIASRLNFPNQSFFGKYFKHATGLTPSDYRQS